MARLRLFAGLREAAGVSESSWPGRTVAEILERAASEYGARFRSGLVVSQVWVNGEPAGPATIVGDDDEIAVIPPVSGGEQAVADTQAAVLQMLYGVGTWIALAVAATISVEATAVFSAAVAAVWAFDVSTVAEARGLRASAMPAVVGAGLVAGASYGYGLEGFGAAVGGAVVLSLVTVVVRPPLRPVDISSVMLLLALTSGLLAGPFLLVRMRSTEESYVLVVVIGAAALAAWAAGRAPVGAQMIDANLVAVVAGTVAGIVGGVAWGDTDGAVFLAAVAGVAGFVAGRTAGGVIRLGHVALASQPPGYLSVIDGALLGTASYWLVLALLGS